MIPRVTSKGKSFKGAGAYFLHDLGKAKTSERVAFTHTVNMLTNDPEKALKVMAWTAEHATELKQVSGQKLTGRKAENPVYNYVLAWPEDQRPDPAHMTAFGLRSLKALGLQDHEAIFIAHNDTDHLHLHVIANRVNPETGIMAKLSKDQLALSRLAQAYEQEMGQVYCANRVANNRERGLGELVKAEKVERLINTPAYQERRAARIVAQREAGALAAGKVAANDAKARQARDVQATFDQKTARDDLQYRAREIVRPEAEEKRAADAAWADERAKNAAGDRTDAKSPKPRHAQTRMEREAAQLDAWRAQKLSLLSGRQADDVDTLMARQAAQRDQHAAQMNEAYGQYRPAQLERIKELSAQIKAKGIQRVVAQLTGAQADAQAELSALRATVRDGRARERVANQILAAEQDAERAARLAEHQGQFTALQERLAAVKGLYGAKRYDQAERAAVAKRGNEAELARFDREHPGVAPPPPAPPAAERDQDAGLSDAFGAVSSSPEATRGRDQDLDLDR